MVRMNKSLIIISLFIIFFCLYVSIDVLAVDISRFTAISQILRCNINVNKADTVFVNSIYNDSTSGWGVLRFNDIHKALEGVANGGTINIECRQYIIKHSETGSSLNVEKDVTIKGTNELGTTIQIGENFNGSSPIVVNSSGSLRLYDLTIDGSGRYTSFAVFCIGGELRMNNVKIQNINLNRSSYGVKVSDSNLSGPGRLFINNCIFSDIGGCGVYVYRSNAEIGVESKNTFKGGGSKFADNQCAIHIEGGINVKVHGNTISGYKVNSASGIFVSSGKVEILGNKISDCSIYRGIYVNTGSVISNVNVTTNTAATVGNNLTDSNTSSIGIYDSGRMIYPTQ